MRSRVAIIALLLVHLLVHTALHAFPAPTGGPVQAERSQGQGDDLSRLENVSCLTCRTAGYALATVAGSGALRLQPCGEHLAAPSAFFFSGWLGSSPGARAPPSAWFS